MMVSGASQKTWAWRQWAILGMGAAILGLLWWQLSTLDPRGWCQVTMDFSKTDRVAEYIESLKTCVGIQSLILGMKDKAIIGLLIAVFMTQLLFLVSEFGMRASAKGLGGEFNVGRDQEVHKVEGRIEGTMTDLNPNQ